VTKSSHVHLEGKGVLQESHLESRGVVVGDKNSLRSFGEQMGWRWVIKSPITRLEAWAARTFVLI